jgi:hypothetical protein
MAVAQRSALVEPDVNGIPQLNRLETLTGHCHVQRIGM